MRGFTSPRFYDATCSNFRKRSTLPTSMKDAVLRYGFSVALYYWITNEAMVCALTFCLHYHYFGKEDLVSVIEKCGVSKYIDLREIEGKSWSFWSGRLEISARLLANFTAASLFMSLFTPLQLPFCIATFPAVSRFFCRLRFISA